MFINEKFIFIKKFNWINSSNIKIIEIFFNIKYLFLKKIFIESKIINIEENFNKHKKIKNILYKIKENIKIIKNRYFENFLQNNSCKLIKNKINKIIINLNINENINISIK